VFERNAGGANNWGLVKSLAAADGAPGERFGFSVSISNDTAIVGADGDDSAGSAYVFTKNQGGANNWGQVKKLIGSDPGPGFGFGLSVSIGNDTAIVGSLGANSFNGGAFIFERNQGGPDNWGEVKKLSASDGVMFDLFGQSVAIQNDVVVIGATADDSFKGSAYVFARNTGGADNWGEVRKLVASDGGASDEFGRRVAISGDTAIVGAARHNSNRGAAYLFGRNQGAPENWGQQQKLTASDAAAEDFFGFSVAIECKTAIVGAPENGPQQAAYIFSAVDVTPPVITCPANVFAATTPGSTSSTVTYPTPETSDDIGVVSLVCVPEASTVFPVGTTTVTCTASDAAGNSAQCSFTVTLFDACLQDDSNGTRVLLFITAGPRAGDYVFCCGAARKTGKGTVSRKGNVYTLTHASSDRRIQATLDNAVGKGSASLQSPPGSTACSINDRNTRNNACDCSGS
jgi:hypothetical protein